MAEAPGQPAAEEAAQPTPEEPAADVITPASFINGDGTFKEGWQNALVPEDFRSLGIYKTVTDVTTALTQLGNLDKLKGMQGKGIRPLTKDASPTEKELYFKAIGRPDKAEEYKWEVPKELADRMKPDVMAKVKEFAHKIGATQEQFAEFMAYDAGNFQAAEAAQKAAEEAADAKGLEELQTRWGAAFDERKAIVQKVLRDNMKPDDLPAIENAINKNPALADLLSEIGKKTIEGSIETESDTGGKMTPAEAKLTMQEKIAERAQNPNLRSDNPAKYKRLNDEIEALAKLALAGQ